MNYLEKTVKLNDGYEMPIIGAGMWQVKPQDAEFVSKTALKLGYKHIDDAVAYGNETEVGKGIKESGIDRSDVFVTSKIPAEVKNYKEAKKVIDDSIQRLGVGYLDLMLIHAPKPWALMFIPFGKNYFQENIEVYKAMEEARAEGKLKSIGVSNFKVKDLENIAKNCSVPIAVNQIRIHIGHVPDDVINYCKEHNIVVQAYSPLGTGKLLKNRNVIAVAEKYNVSVSQLCIKFILQLDLVVLPKTTHEEYMKNNVELDFEISQEDMDYLKNLPGIF